jgi:hypothetical protein
VDQFSKLVNAVPTKKSVTASQTAELLFTHWFLKGYGIPNNIISDRDSLFTSNTFNEFIKLTGIQQTLSTSRHQRTDGGAEAVVKKIKTILKKFSNYKSTNWATNLPQVLFAINNSTHATTHFTPFYLAHAFNPITIPIINNSNNLTNFPQFLTEYNNNITTATKYIYEQQQQQINKFDRTRNSPPNYKVNDLVLLNRNGIQWPADSERDPKLLPPLLGPFRILAVDDKLDNIKLDLPPYLSTIHNNFHLQLITPYQQDTTWHRYTNPQPEPELDPLTGDEIFELEKILDAKKFRNTFKFLVKWKGYGNEQNTWIPLKELANATELLNDYYQQHPESPAYNKFPANYSLNHQALIDSANTSSRGGVP